MIKVSVLYPNEEGKKFDMDYYCQGKVDIAYSVISASSRND